MLCFRADYEASSKNLYAVYKLWCDDNALNSLAQKSFCSFLKQNESGYNVKYTNKIDIDEMLKQPNCPFVLYVDAKKLVKRKAFEEFIESRVAI